MKPESKSRQRATPKAQPHRKRSKRFGLTYRMTYFGEREVWYETAKSRDQAIASHNNRYSNSDWITKATPIERSAHPTSEKQP